MPDHPDPTPANYTQYLHHLYHLERLLYRHRRYRLIGIPALLATLSLGTVSWLQNGPPHDIALAMLGVALCLVLMKQRHARASRNQLKIVLLMERITPPGAATPLPRSRLIQDLEHPRRFIKTLSRWLDSERDRSMMAIHLIDMKRRYS